MPEPLASPTCPGCGQPPLIVFDSGHQAMCGNGDGCTVVMWDATKDPAELGRRLKTGEHEWVPDVFDQRQEPPL